MKQDPSQVDRIFESLDGMGKATMPPYFYTRLKARMENELLQKSTPNFLLRPAFLSACLLLVLLVNIISLQYKNHPKLAVKQSASIESFAYDYNMNTEFVYE